MKVLRKPQLCCIVMSHYIIGPFSSPERARNWRDKHCGKVAGRKAKVLPFLPTPSTAQDTPI